MDLENKYDLVVLCGGPAGTPTALEYGTLYPNKKILLVDKLGKLGGECLFEGCIPSKILLKSGEEYSNQNETIDFGIESPNEKSKLIWEDIVKRKVNILDKRSNAALNKLNSLGNVTLIKGIARFIDKNTINIKLAEINEEKIISFKKAVIGTGTRTFIPLFKGNGLDKVWTNNEFFRDLEHPKTLTIIGDGPIGIELSQILSNLDIKINLIGNKNSILPMIDKEFSQIVLDKIKENKNINLILDADVSEVNFNDNLFDVVYSQNGEEKNINSEKVLIATGRTPNIEELDLDKANIKFEKRGIVVNDYLQTTNKNIYAAGDVILHGPQFAHTASYEAHIMVQNLFFGRNKFKVNFDKNSWVLFSEPNVVSAGISEEKAIEKGFEVITGLYDFSIDAKSQIYNADYGFMKFVVNKKNLELLGITIATPDAQSLAGEAALLISKSVTLKELVSVIHPHPTLSESFTFLAKMMMGKIVQERMKNPMFKIGFFIKKYL